MAWTAAAMYGGATFDGAIEGLIPGDPAFAVAPAVAAAVVVALIVAFGPRLPRAALALLGPIGVVLIAAALAATPGAGDGAILYVWPVLWSTFFFGRRGAIGILLCIAAAHLLVLLEVPAVSSFAARWVDVMVSTTVVAGVVLTLVRHNDEMLSTLESEARTDVLTELLNRRGFEERATLEMARARREDRWIAVVAFDLDYFKRINDEWGHDVGDRVLHWTAEVLLDESREIDVVARFGGEEFVVLLPGADSVEGRMFAERVRSALARGDGSLPMVSISAGIWAERAPSQLDALLQGADSALYSAKRGGRDRALIFEREEHFGGAPMLAGLTGSPAFSPQIAPQARRTGD